MNVLLSYPRSGNTWIRYVVEHLSGMPTSYPESAGDNPIATRVKMDVDLDSDLILHKSHNIENTAGVNLLVIVRDYKEALPRHFLESDGLIAVTEFFQKETAGIKNVNADYIKILQQYDRMAGNKLLIYYEDIITNPKPQIVNIAKFLKIYNKTKIEDFFENYDWHKQQGLKAYHATSKTQGDPNKLKYHQLKLSAKDCAVMMGRLKTKYPTIYQKYLLRYDV